MEKNFILFFLLLLSATAFAQQHTVKGQVSDTQGEALPSATVLLLHPKDSTIKNQTFTDTNGFFSLEEIKGGYYILKVTFLGYRPHFDTLTTPPRSSTVNLGTLRLQPDTIQLNEVTIENIRDIVVKTDTVEYNASSFTTRPNASTQQLLNRLPGVEIDRDGNITVQGERVTRIFVDGKELFGSNLRKATQTLPANAISKIQVIDDKSEETRFSGIDDGRRQKVINLTIKEDRKNMGFGKATVGLGSQNRYAAEGNYNLMDGPNLVSASGASNNINNLDLTGDTPGAGTQPESRSGQKGLAKTHSGSTTVFKQLSKKTSINGNYLFNYSDQEILSNMIRQNFLPEGTAVYNENSRQQNINNLHNASAGVEHKDSLNTFRLNTSFNFSTDRLASASNRQSFSVSNDLVNDGERNAQTRNKNIGIDAHAFYGHRFGSSGRLFTINAQLYVNQEDANGHSDAITRFLEGNDETLKQLNLQDNKEYNFSSQFAYTEPLGNKQYLEASYKIANQSSGSIVEVYDIENEISMLNPEQSSHFGSRFLYQRAGLTYRLNRAKFNLSVGANAQQSLLMGNFQEPVENIRRSFQNILPNLTFNKQVNKTTRLVLIYGTSIREPNISQMQPIISTFDPLHLYIGNPGLRPEYTHQGKLSFQTSRPLSSLFLSGNLTYSHITNPITASVNIDERQVRTTQYVNVGQSRSASAYFTASLPVKGLYSRFNLSPYLREGQSINLLNGVSGLINQRTIGGNIGYTFQYEEIIDIQLRTNISNTRSHYLLNREQNQSFFNAGSSALVSVYFLKRFNIATDFSYSRFINTRVGFNQGIPIANCSVSMFMFKDNKGEIKLSGFNILNRNIGITQTASLNFIEQSTHNALGNFFILSFTYNFNIKK